LEFNSEIKVIKMITFALWNTNNKYQRNFILRTRSSAVIYNTSFVSLKAQFDVGLLYTFMSPNNFPAGEIILIPSGPALKVLGVAAYACNAAAACSKKYFIYHIEIFKKLLILIQNKNLSFNQCLVCVLMSEFVP
jgi:hypothetical protein